MKSKEKELTNEGLSSLFSDNFQLAVTAIRLAQNEVHAGKEVSLHQILGQIKQHPQMYCFENRMTMPAFDDED